MQVPSGVKHVKLSATTPPCTLSWPTSLYEGRATLALNFGDGNVATFPPVEDPGYTCTDSSAESYFAKCSELDALIPVLVHAECGRILGDDSLSLEQVQSFYQPMMKRDYEGQQYSPRINFAMTLDDIGSRTQCAKGFPPKPKFTRFTRLTKVQGQVRQTMMTPQQQLDAGIWRRDVATQFCSHFNVPVVTPPIEDEDCPRMTAWVCVTGSSYLWFKRKVSGAGKVEYEFGLKFNAGTVAHLKSEERVQETVMTAAGLDMVEDEETKESATSSSSSSTAEQAINEEDEQDAAAFASSFNRDEEDEDEDEEDTNSKKRKAAAPRRTKAGRKKQHLMPEDDREA